MKLFIDGEPTELQAGDEIYHDWNAFELWLERKGKRLTFSNGQDVQDGFYAVSDVGFQSVANLIANLAGLEVTPTGPDTPPRRLVRAPSVFGYSLSDRQSE